MASVSAGQVGDALLADAEFRALRLGTWLNTPSGEGVAAAVEVPGYSDPGQAFPGGRPG
jgi:hypothetical protein